MAKSGTNGSKSRSRNRPKERTEGGERWAPSPAVQDAIVQGYHGSPHSDLGPQLVSLSDTKKSAPAAEQTKTETTAKADTDPKQADPEQIVVVRAFRPTDSAVFVLDAKTGVRHAMEQIHPSGLFQLAFLDRHDFFPYRLVLVGEDGNEYEIDDPYRFRDEWFTSFDQHLHAEGRFLESYRKFGAHFRTLEGVRGVQFAVWAPNAQRVSVIGGFNGWDDRTHPMQRRGGGVWEIFLPNLPEGTDYKYSVKSRLLDYKADKTDPYGFASQMRPETGSVIWDIDKYEWNDEEWLGQRPEIQALDQPINIYEVHLGSWKRVPEDNGFLSYQDLAHQMVDHVKKLGFTHIELLPITEHPFDGSWGYQTTGYFAPTSRFGTPDDFKYFVDYCHQNNIGVILDWVPAHFPKDVHGLGFFDGTHLYEHEDPRQGEHRDWGTKIFNFGRNEVRNFLLASAIFWLKEYHLDGLRVDAVASMLYLDYSREAGDWVPNKYGGRENLEAIDFIRTFNEVTHEYASGILTIAEESTSWPMVSRPTYTGGLGFDMKWNMGWMHDTLEYFEMDPLFRRYHHNRITFSLVYAFSENFVLPFSHDEVVHLKKSMLDKMPGDLWQKFANLRSLYAYMIAHPGKKLLFMGAELGQWREWNEAVSMDWHLLDYDLHRQLMDYMGEVNRLYQQEPALHQIDTSWEGFSWIDLQDIDNSIISFQRSGKTKNDFVVVVCNFTPVVRRGYRIGLPQMSTYREIFNSDWTRFGGSGVGNNDELHAEEIAWQNGTCSVTIDLPPLAVVVLKPQTAGQQSNLAKNES